MTSMQGGGMVQLDLVDYLAHNPLWEKKSYRPKKFRRGTAMWQKNNTVYLSVVFTWDVPEAIEIAKFEHALGKQVKVAGPGMFRSKLKHEFKGIAEIGGKYKDAIVHHNPDATVASRGCPLNCDFCIVTKMEGKKFTELDDFIPRPILCDNNLSALSVEYQNYIIRRYAEEKVLLKDANSGFEPMTFNKSVYKRWKPIMDAGGSPWRFGYDNMKERKRVLRVMKMLADERPGRKRPYVLIGNEPFEECMLRITESIEHGCEPHVQPVIKLNAAKKAYWVKNGWTKQLLTDVARWTNRRLWRSGTFDEYNRSYRKKEIDERQIYLDL